MSDHRSLAEKFVTEFLDYVEKYDIFDEFDKRSQKMVRSAGVDALIKKAASVFPGRVKIGQLENDAISKVTKSIIIEEAPNIIDRRDLFSRKVQENGSARGLLEKVLLGDKKAIILARELVDADNGKKEFYVPPKD